ncbi:MAG: thermonuclease family protein [Patescibacteria group bacterium]|nr:thermonuclease family protein [Patescibacteria group bacterium]MBU2509120.1 thermonuclease family protein [Patescibacteria group bacterium]
MPKRLYIFLTALLIPFLISVGFLIKSVDFVALAKQEIVELEQEQISELDFIKTSTTQTNATVTKSVDGDTFHATLDNEPGDWTIRMLGIDTPETVHPNKPVECFGKEASKVLEDLLLGKRIRLESDPQADERDKYDRLLRNVYLEDGTDVNATMVQNGYAHAYLSFPQNSDRKTELRRLEQDAKINERGLWNPEVCDY